MKNCLLAQLAYVCWDWRTSTQTAQMGNMKMRFHTQHTAQILDSTLGNPIQWGSQNHF